jgi:hypothetical protein
VTMSETSSEAQINGATVSLIVSSGAFYTFLSRSHDGSRPEQA